MKKIFTLLSIVALSSVTFAQDNKAKLDLTKHEITTLSQQQNKADDHTFSQLSTQEITGNSASVSCDNVQYPVTLTRFYDLKNDYGITGDFTPVSVGVFGRAMDNTVVETTIVNYNGTTYGSTIPYSSVTETDNYGSKSLAKNEVGWFDIEFIDAFSVAEGQKIGVASTYIMAGADNGWVQSFLPWLTNQPGLTETRPTYFGHPTSESACGVIEDNYADIRTNVTGGSAYIYVVNNLTGTTETMGTVELGSSKLAVYPNPATTEVNIKLDGTKVADVTVADVTGRVIPVKFSKDGKVDTSKLSSGVYFLRVKDDKGVTRIQKIIKK
ncbi:T9SS type A sorting domain-containing protein [Empedobacter brevis]|uniref:T9SS type A sorting domain-containing protein n=1 Tax=Empedobacter brevis TaxID=247 RepID=UPI0028D48ECF|nr:T9SS type A sorting domain-containing protein [Empedobacter brevis]